MTESEGNERLLAHAAWLQGLARSVVAQHDLAHDVAQDTLMVALRRGTAAGVPLETVRTRLRRGLQQLRDDLDRRHGSSRGWALPLLGIRGFEEAAALAATGSAAATVAVGAGAMAMSVAIKTGAAVAAVGVVWLAWSGWPSL
ncbi:MAG: hypothetical protein WAT39_23800, partial [Planctomycetota bacterium]